MKFKLFLLCLSICLLNCANPNTSLYVGTYTDGDSEGIYQFQFNTETGELTNKQLAAISENPSYLTYSPDKNYVYAVNENEDGTTSSFKVEDDNRLTSLNIVSTHGAHPCHISVNESGDKAIASNYTGGNASIYTIKNDGSLNDSFQILNHNIDSIVSHAHSAQFHKDNLYISDLGKNGVYKYQLDHNKKDYRLVTPSIIKMTDHAGPRHFSLTKDGQFIYIINEYANTITSGKKTDNGFELLENTSTLDDGFKGASYCADIHLSKNEDFLYGSNRGENSMAVFKRNPSDGTIEKTQNISVYGDWPRNFTLDPTGKFMLVANQKSHNISVFKINKENGKLTFLHSTDLPSPVCLLF
ncbi:lactonase family protein [Flavivirga spongiicola]|uniref:Lactonase family protein n=1 Tax=Flavivirga spongiicola TaxID=421621 RepID=A0ABU7XRH7_9FLAO|nr:lactonase family protein [Flavivirga sp. MEBiC05379]MDO5978385.1 lactonase family protein [Flavivirga sp. MEBiC05379]